MDEARARASWMGVGASRDARTSFGIRGRTEPRAWLADDGVGSAGDRGCPGRSPDGPTREQGRA